jgi:hypothetical protein
MIVSEQNIVTASFGQIFVDNLYVLTSSFQSGSNKIGDSLSDNHEFTGSVSVTGSFDVCGTISQCGNPITLPSVYTQSIGDNSNQSFTVTHNLNSTLVSVHMLNQTSTQIYYPTQQTASVIRGSFHAFITGSNSVVINTPYIPTTNEFLIVVKT